MEASTCHHQIYFMLFVYLALQHACKYKANIYQYLVSCPVETLELSADGRLLLLD